MAFYVKMSTAPGECAKEAMRQGIGVSAAVCMGYAVADNWSGIDPDFKKAWLQSWKWAAITAAVVTSPVIGKVAKVSFERFLGTIAGGLLAFLAVYIGKDHTPWSNEITCTVATAIAAASAQMIGQRAGSAYAAKLSTVTFVLVIMGASDATSATTVTISRICGILGGVFISLCLSVLVFPKSAAAKATDGMDEGLDAVVGLSRMAWGSEGSQAIKYNGTGADSSEAANGYAPLAGTDEEAGQKPANRAQKLQGHREEVLHSVYSKLSDCQDNLPLARNEVYVCTVRNRWYFLPAIPGLRGKRRTFPNQEMNQLATAVRQVARMLWSVHVCLQMGFEEEVLNLLRRHYPAHIMPDLQRYSQLALEDLADCFPHAHTIRRHNLDKYLQTVGELTKIASERRSTKQRLLNSLTDIEYKSLGKDPKDAPQVEGGSGPSEDGHANIDTATPGDKAALDQSHRQEGSDDQPSLAFFPADHSGYIAKVRWYSFQFAMQQLSEALSDAFDAMSEVLPSLPAEVARGAAAELD